MSVWHYVCLCASVSVCTSVCRYMVTFAAYILIQVYAYPHSHTLMSIYAYAPTHTHTGDHPSWYVCNSLDKMKEGKKADELKKREKNTKVPLPVEVCMFVNVGVAVRALNWKCISLHVYITACVCISLHVYVAGYASLCVPRLTYSSTFPKNL